MHKSGTAHKATRSGLVTAAMMLACILAVWFLGGVSTASAAERKPNIVLIFSDDLGWKDVGYQGGVGFETPNIDRLAKEGMVFTNGYAAAGNCEPSRACLLTGNYTPRHRVIAVNSSAQGPVNEMRLIPIPNVNGLRTEHITIAEMLKAAGYATGIFGKWQLTRQVGVEPQEQGFDVVFQSDESWGKLPDREKEIFKGENPKGIYSLTAAACEFMESNQERPFFVYLPHYAIHAGLSSRSSSLAKFKSKEIDEKHASALYLANTYDLDDGVGIVMKKLKELGLEANTLVIFTSDNGGTLESVQEPLRGNKGCYYEGGIREPLIVRWPGVTAAGSRCDVPVISQDFFPTFLAVAGVPISKGKGTEGKVMDGESLLPLLNGKGSLQRKAIFWHFPGYLDGPVNRGRELDVRTGFRTRPISVIRKGDWKLHLFLEEWVLDGGRGKLATNNAIELYNLKDDIGERINLSNRNIAKRDELLNDLLAWQKSINAPIPTEANSKYTPDAGPKPNRKRKPSINQ